MSSVFCLQSSRFALRVSRLTLLSLFAFHFSPFTASVLRAEEWGFSFSGQLLQVVDRQKSVARHDGSTNYAATIFVRLYDDSEGAATGKAQAIWGRRIDVHAKNGTFSCELKDSAGDGQPLANTAYARLQDAFAHLGGSVVTVGVTPFNDLNAEISPRQRLAAVPFAVNAGDALGTVGDVTIPGTLKTGAFKAADVVFGGTVSHAGNATFQTDPMLPRLTLGDSEPLKVETMTVAGEVAVKRIEADTLETGDAKVKVSKLTGGSVANLAVSGAVTARTLGPVDKALETTGDVSVQDLVVKDFVLGGGMDLFQWADGPTELPQSEQEAKWYYTGSASSGHWTAACNCLLSLNIKTAGTVTVKLSRKDGGEDVVGTIQASGSASGWFPFQVFMRKDQKISWTGGSTGANTIRVTCREFKY